MCPKNPQQSLQPSTEDFEITSPYKWQKQVGIRAVSGRLLRTSSNVDDLGLAVGVTFKLTSVELRFSSVASSGGINHSTRPA